MIHPSYAEMVDAIRSSSDPEEKGIDISRFSIVQATAKRARQIVAGAEPLVEVDTREGKLPKALSIAVNEFYQDKVHITNDQENSTEA